MNRVPDQVGLFDEGSAAALPGIVQLAPADPELLALAACCRERFGDRLRLGTSSWSFPGWGALVWAREHSVQTLAQHGLPAYARHPLFGCVSLDRSFYRPLDAATYAGYAAQVPSGFRFMVKAASLVCDAVVRDAPQTDQPQPNPLFLDPQVALHDCVLPAVQGLGTTLGAIVFQLSPLPPRWLDAHDELIDRLDALWRAITPGLPEGVHAALEVRDADLLTPALAASLKAHGVRYCVGLHDRMPSIDEQLSMLRATWPGDLLCRWNLQRGLKYDAARNLFAPFDRLQAPDAATREELARVIAATLAAGYRAFVTISNKAEGSAPLSVIELAREVLRQRA